jgi:hypothetical protein
LQHIPLFHGKQRIWDNQQNLIHELESIYIYRKKKFSQQINNKNPTTHKKKIKIKIKKGSFTIVPNVIKPTQAYSGNKLKLTINDSFKALRSSSSRQVSTTNKKMGGI